MKATVITIYTRENECEIFLNDSEFVKIVLYSRMHQDSR